MDMCHLKNAELEAKHQKYKGRVVLRGDIVKDDSGSYSAFSEQGFSASQMTAAKIMGIISKFDCQVGLSKFCRRIVGVVDPTKLKQVLACVLEADESKRLRMEESLPKCHEDHVAGRGDTSLQHYNLVQFFFSSKAMKIPAAKAAVDK